MAIGITVGNLDNRSQCFTMRCCLDVFAWGMKHNVYYLRGIHFALGKSVPKHHCGFFLCSNWLQRNVKDRLIQANSIFAEKPHFHTQSRGQVFHKNTLGLAVPIIHGYALSPRDKLREAAQCSANSQVHAPANSQCIPPLTAKALPCGAGKTPTRCERGKYKKLVHTVGF